MAILKLTSSGGGVQSIDTPSTSSNFTSTLPGTTGTLLNTASSLAAANLTGTVVDARISALTASKLTGALPAISGAALTGISSGGVTHLGTMTTTSGTSQSITGLDFTALNLLIFVVAQVSHSDGTSRKLQIGIAGGPALAIGNDITAGNCSIGHYTFDLRSNIGHFAQSPGNAPITSGYSFVGGGTGHSRYNIGTNLRSSSSTSVNCSFEGGVTFDNGKVEVYGLK